MSSSIEQAIFEKIKENIILEKEVQRILKENEEAITKCISKAEGSRRGNVIERVSAGRAKESKSADLVSINGLLEQD
jgi:hypothetical protein